MKRSLLIFSLIFGITIPLYGNSNKNSSNQTIILSNEETVQRYPFINDPDFKNSLQLIWDKAGHGQFEFEASFSVHKLDQGWQFRQYPVSRELDKFKVPFNLSFRALIHTHRDLSEQLPSEVDKSVARQKKIPIFVFSKKGLSVFDPKENVIFVLKVRG